MILRILMKQKPQRDIYEVIGNYFLKSSVDLKEEVHAYLDERVVCKKLKTFVVIMYQILANTYCSQQHNNTREINQQNESFITMH